MGRVLIGTVLATLLGSGLSAQSLTDMFAKGLEACAPYAQLSNPDITSTASQEASGALKEAFMWRYAYDPEGALRFVDGADLVMITSGVKGCWLVGAHEGYEDLLEAVDAWVAATPGLRKTQELSFGVAADRSNAEVGAILTVQDLNVTILSFGPADGGFYEMNIE